MPNRRVRTHSPQLTFALFLVAPMAFLGVSTLVAHRNFRKMEENHEWVRHTQEVINELEGSYAALAETISAQRGYLLDPRPLYEGYYRERREIAVRRLTKVRELVADSPTSIARVEQLREAVREKLEDTERIVAARKQRGEAGLERFKRPQTSESLGRIREMIRDLIASQQILLSRRSEEAEASSQTAFTTLWVNLVAGLSLSGLLWATSARYRQLREDAQEAERRYTEELEHKVLERTAELKSTNAELEAFSYSVSHDLRAPIRAMSGYASMLEEDHREHLNDDAMDSIARIKAAAGKMSLLIDGLLRLSRITRSEMQEGLVNLSDIATEILRDLQEREPNIAAETKVKPGVVVKGDAQMLRILLENLIRNAWKYSSKSDRVRIEFGEVEGDPPRFFVSDSGAGFDMEYAGKLFEPFQRLHSERDYEGTGIGLAICRRIVARHGGRIWAEGKLGRGAKFSFTLDPDPHDLREQLDEALGDAVFTRTR